MTPVSIPRPPPPVAPLRPGPRSGAPFHRGLLARAVIWSSFGLEVMVVWRDRASETFRQRFPRQWTTSDRIGARDGRAVPGKG
jgi:hypothetical protein